jgi:hypothetical protein
MENLVNKLGDDFEGTVRQDLRKCHNQWLVRDTTSLITTFRISISVTAPYKKIC